MAIIKLYANLRTLAGGKELSVAGASVRVVLKELVRQRPSLEGAILAKGSIGEHVVLIANGLNVTDLDQALSEEDVLAIFPPIAGGLE